MKTAIEWYNSKIKIVECWVETKQITWKEYHKERDRLIEQAKEMEKQQIIEAIVWFDDTDRRPNEIEIDAEQYYNETYGQHESMD